MCITHGAFIVVPIGLNKMLGKSIQYRSIPKQIFSHQMLKATLQNLIWVKSAGI